MQTASFQSANCRYSLVVLEPSHLPHAFRQSCQQIVDIHCLEIKATFMPTLVRCKFKKNRNLISQKHQQFSKVCGSYNVMTVKWNKYIVNTNKPVAS